MASPTSPVFGKVIAITGGASGIGKATSTLLASRGATLSLADLNKDALESTCSELQSQYGIKVLTTVVDVRNVKDVDDWIENTVKTFGKLDGAANLAGVISKDIGSIPLKDQDESEWDFVIGVNLTGVMHSMRAELKAMSEGGAIVNASSIAGIQGRAYNAPYSAAKHGVIGLTRSAAKEEGSRGIRVNAICPGYIVTPMTQLSNKLHSAAGKAPGEEWVKYGTALERGGKATEVASLIAFLLGDESKYITGAVHTIDGGVVC